MLVGYDLNDRQRKAINMLKINGSITNSKYQELFSIAKRTASLDLSSLVNSGLVKKIGKTGKGVHYQLMKGAEGAIVANKNWSNLALSIDIC